MNKYNFPTPIYSAPGLLGRLSEIADLQSGGKLNGRALLVTDQGLMGTDIPDRVKVAFEKIGNQLEIFSDVETNPDDRSVEKGTAAYRSFKADFIVAVGGGSPQDVAKTIAVRLNHDGPLEKYDDLDGGDKYITKHVPPVIAVPTTAGTGSEVSRSSVIHIEAVDRKVVIFSPLMMPALALLDAELTTGLPRKITAYTGIDALTHLLEAYCATGYHPMADGIALEGVGKVFQFLPKVLEDGMDLEARGEMLNASLMGAVAFQKGLGAAHSMAHPLSSVSGLHHGLANAMVLKKILEFNRAEIGRERFLKLSMAAAPGEHASYETFMGALDELLKLSDIPVGLSTAGVKEEHIPELTKLALADGCHGSNPRKCELEDFETLFKELL